MAFFPINLPKIEPQYESHYRLEVAGYEAALQVHKGPWWRLGRQLACWCSRGEGPQQKSGRKGPLLNAEQRVRTCRDMGLHKTEF